MILCDTNTMRYVCLNSLTDKTQIDRHLSIIIIIGLSVSRHFFQSHNSKTEENKNNAPLGQLHVNISWRLIAYIRTVNSTHILFNLSKFGSKFCANCIFSVYLDYPHAPFKSVYCHCILSYYTSHAITYAVGVDVYHKINHVNISQDNHVALHLISLVFVPIILLLYIFLQNKQKRENCTKSTFFFSVKFNKFKMSLAIQCEKCCNTFMGDCSFANLNRTISFY